MQANRGHQWNWVCAWMTCGRACQASQRGVWTSGRSSRSWTCGLARASFVKGQRRSAGWSAGAYGGQAVPRQAHRALALRAHLPPSPLEHQEDVLAPACPHRLGERGESERERRPRHGGEQEPDRPTGGRLDKGLEVAPPGALRPHRARALSTGTPAPAQDGLEADPVSGGRPQRYHRLRVGVRQGLHAAG
jgi:hypothetical protein